MTFRVIEGGGRPILPAAGTAEEARAEVIDRVAAAIWQRGWPRDGETWAMLLSDAAEGDSLACLQLGDARNMARAAIGALAVSAPPEAEHLLFKEIGLDAEAAANAMAVIDDFVEAVLS